MIPFYCSPRGCLCGNYECEKNIIRAAHGYAVAVDDLSTKCGAFEPRYVVTAHGVEEMQERIERLIAEHPDQTPLSLLSSIELRGISMEEEARVFAWISQMRADAATT